jgi:hypothetical protein
MFQIDNLSKSSYLVNRSTGVSFEIPVKWIYEEYTIRSRCSDERLINQVGADECIFTIRLFPKPRILLSLKKMKRSSL